VVKKSLGERWHTCPCGASCHRDVNAALVLLHWGMHHVLSVFLASLWLHNNGSQELTPGLGTQNLHPEP
jgi:transposase